MVRDKAHAWAVPVRKHSVGTETSSSLPLWVRECVCVCCGMLASLYVCASACAYVHLFTPRKASRGVGLV